MAELAIESLSDSNAEELIDLLANVDGVHFTHTSRESVRRFLEEPADVHLLGRAHGLAVAFGMLRGWQEGYETPSLGIAVRRDHEGHEHGRAMMAALERVARERGVPAIRLRVHADNTRARKFYDALGYREMGIERGQILMTLEFGEVAPKADLDGSGGGADTPRT